MAKERTGEASPVAPAASEAPGQGSVLEVLAVSTRLGLTSFGGLAWTDAQVLALGHGYEQASRQRRAPRFLLDADASEGQKA